MYITNNDSIPQINGYNQIKNYFKAYKPSIESVSGSIPTSSDKVPQPLDTSTEESLIIMGSNVDVKLTIG